MPKMLHNDSIKNLIMRIFFLLCCLGVCLSLMSCASKPKSTVTGTKPYTVRGQKYYPLQTADGFVEEGVASWYGPGFHGKLTANGETYNQNAMTAAHKLLPLGTTVRVTNLENNKSLVLRINDRGPFLHDRIIDLSKRAAQRLDMYEQGTARVRVEAIDGKGGKSKAKAVAASAVATSVSRPKSQASSAAAKAQAKKSRVLNEDGEIPEELRYLFEDEGSGYVVENNPKPIPTTEQVVDDVASTALGAVGVTEAAQAVDEVFSEVENFPATGDFYVQFGEFTAKKLASLLAAKLEDRGYPARSYKEPDQSLWRVRIGPWSSADKAREFLPKFTAEFQGARVVWAEPKK